MAIAVPTSLHSVCCSAWFDSLIHQPCRLMLTPAGLRLRDRSGRALFRLICVLERGIAFASPANLTPSWSAVCIDNSSGLRRGLYQARAAM